MGRMHPIAGAFLLGVALTAFGIGLVLSSFAELRRRQVSREANTSLKGTLVDVIFRTGPFDQTGRRHAVIEVQLPDGSTKTFEDPRELGYEDVMIGQTADMRYDPVSGHLEVVTSDDKADRRSLSVRWRVASALILLSSGLALTAYVVRHYGDRLW